MTIELAFFLLALLFTLGSLGGLAWLYWRTDGSEAAPRR